MNEGVIASLAEKAKQGDMQAFEQLYTEFSPLVYSILFEITHDAYEAENLTQDCFVSALQNIHTLKEPEKAKKWLTAIAANHGRDYLRKKKPALLGAEHEYIFDIKEEEDVCIQNAAWNKLFKKGLTGRFDTSLSLGEDLLFNIDYLKKCSKVAVIPDALIHYIQEEKGNTLSSKKRDNKLEIASRVCESVQAYYEGLTGEKKLHSVIAGKFVMEFLDDCEKLPFDKETPKIEKLQMVQRLANHPEFMEANKIAEVTLPDYKVLQWCFAHGQWRMVYPICVLRKAVVVVARWIWNR